VTIVRVLVEIERDPILITVPGLRLTFDVTADFAFGVKLGLLGSQHFDSVLKIIKLYGWRMGIYDQCPSLLKLGLEILAVCIQSFTKNGRNWLNWSSKFMSLVLDYSKKTDSHGHRLSKLLRSRDPHTDVLLPPQELWAESAFFMLAGLYWFFI